MFFFWRHQAITWANVENHQWGLVSCIWGGFHRKWSLLRFRKSLISAYSRISQGPRTLCAMQRSVWYRLYQPLAPYAILHYNDVIMGAIASQITSLTIVYSTVYSDADQRKYQSSASLAFVRGIHRGPVNSPHKWPVMRKILPIDDVIMICLFL